MLLMRNHPITGALVHGIYNKLANKEKTGKKPLTDEDKYKTAFENLASVQDPKVRAAIRNMPQELQQKYSQKLTPRLDLQSRMQAVRKNLRDISGVGDLLTTAPVKPVQFGPSMATHHPLANATPYKPTSPRPEVTTGQARKKKVTPV